MILYSIQDLVLRGLCYDLFHIWCQAIIQSLIIDNYVSKCNHNEFWIKQNIFSERMYLKLSSQVSMGLSL